MRYFKLLYDYEKSDGWVFCDDGDIGNLNKYILSCGEKIDEWKDVVFRYNPDEGAELTDYLSNIYIWLVVSASFREQTKELTGGQVQYLPVRITDRTTGREAGSYFAANIINVADALDLENSDYSIFELDDEKVFAIKKYALKGSMLEGSHIFRLKGELSSIFISESLKEVIEGCNFTGFDFTEVKVT